MKTTYERQSNDIVEDETKQPMEQLEMLVHDSEYINETNQWHQLITKQPHDTSIKKHVRNNTTQHPHTETTHEIYNKGSDTLTSLK